MQETFGSHPEKNESVCFYRIDSVFSSGYICLLSASMKLVMIVSFEKFRVFELGVEERSGKGGR